MLSPALSVVAPCFDEEAVLPEFLQRMGAVLDALPDGVGADSEIVVVDDGSRDGTWAVLSLSLCRGERILVIDADLQDPPELLPDMMRLMDEGADVVYGQRRLREGETLFKRASAAIFYRLIGRMTDVAIPTDAGDFRLMTRRVVDLLAAMPERHRFIRGMVAWIGGKQVPILYDRKPRAAGESKYPVAKMVTFAADAVTAFSVVPLRASMTIGWVMALVGLAFFAYSIVGWLLDYTLPGWTSLMAAIGLLGGMQFLMLGIIGAYLGRLYDQSKGRPLFMIREIVGGPK